MSLRTGKGALENRGMTAASIRRAGRKGNRSQAAGAKRNQNPNEL